MLGAGTAEGGSALHAAVRSDGLQVVKVLLGEAPDAAALFAARDRDGKTALEVAHETFGLELVAKWLIEWGAANNGTRRVGFGFLWGLWGLR